MYQQPHAPFAATQFGRLFLSASAAATVTFGLFVVMDRLTTQERVVVAPPVPMELIDPFFQHEEPPVLEDDKLPDMPKPQTQPKTLVNLEPLEPDSQTFGDGFEPTLPKIEDTRANSGELGFADGGARTVFRMQPKYPIDAARNGIEGWVKLMFSIDVSGQVKDIQVMDAEPKRVFDKAARRALSKWKYRPQIIDGRPVPQSGMQVVLDFKLDGYQSI